MGITSIFGVFIRPRKKTAGRDRCVNLRFVLEGSIPAKKSNQDVVKIYGPANVVAKEIIAQHRPMTWDDYKRIRNAIRVAIKPNDRHKEWHDRVSSSIITQRDYWLPQIASKGLFYPLQNCSLSVYSYLKDHRVRDLSGIVESLQDLLKDCQVIADDNSRNLHPVTIDSEVYAEEIISHTHVVNLTVYY